MGGPGAALGGPRGTLRLSWSHLGAIFVVDNLLIKFCSDFCSDFERQGSPKEAPEAPRGDPEPLGLATGPVLGRSWPVLGGSGRPKLCCGPSGARFFEKSALWKKYILKAILEPTWANLGAQEAPKDPQEAPIFFLKNFGGDPRGPKRRGVKSLYPADHAPCSASAPALVTDFVS